MNFPKHAEYRESGVEWLGKVPAHWDVPPCRAIVIERSERNENGDCNDYLSLMANIGIIPYADKGDIGNKKPEDLSKCKMVHEGDFVINSMNYYIGSYGVSSYNGVCSPVYIVMTPRNEVVDSRFAFRVFEDKRFQKYAQSFGNGILEHRRSINWDILKTIPVPVPPLDEQKVIASFLDAETSRIDSLVSEQSSLIELLKEKRQAVISHTVTKGLNPNAPLKHSGIEWLGNVPARWEVSRIKFMVRSSDGIQMGPFGGMLLDLDGEDTGYKVFGQENTISGEFARGQRWVSQERYEELERYAIKDGDLVLTRKGSLGNAWLIEGLPQPGIIDSDTIRIRVDDKMVAARYLAKLLHEAPYISEQITRQKRGAILPGLNTGIIANLVVALPNRDEQNELLNHLDSESLRFDALQAEAERAIELLQERRTAIISAAVTGKIDARGIGSKEAA